MALFAEVGSSPIESLLKKSGGSVGVGDVVVVVVGGIGVDDGAVGDGVVVVVGGVVVDDWANLPAAALETEAGGE